MKGQYKFVAYTRLATNILYLARKKLTLDNFLAEIPSVIMQLSKFDPNSLFFEETKRGKFRFPKTCFGSPKSHSFSWDLPLTTDRPQPFGDRENLILFSSISL